MKQLKTTTINKYTTRQLVKHLDLVQDQFNDAPYRIDWNYNQLLRLEGDAYFFESSLDDRDSIIDAIQKSWKLVK